MEDRQRGALPMERHRISWKVLEGTGSFWTCVIRVCAWMTERLYASCFLSCLIVVSLPYLDMWTLLILTHCCLLLLTDCLLSMTHYAYDMLVEVLISHSRVTGSSPAWLLVFTTEAVLESIAEASSLHSYPVWLVSLLSNNKTIIHQQRHYSAVGLLI